MTGKMGQMVSVIVPAYNHEKYVKDALDSVTGQTYKNLEIIVVDDGSSDHTGTICENLSKIDSRIRVYRQANQGAHSAINNGIRFSCGEYIAILNSDDLFLPNKIKRCLKIVDNNPNIQFVSGHPELIDSAGKTLIKGIEVDWQKRAYDYYDSTGLLALSILNENFIATTSNMFFSRSLWKRNRHFQPLRYCHDLDFLEASFRNALCFLDGKTPHIKYRIHSGNTIKEELKKVRVEISAVIATSLIMKNTCLTDNWDGENVLAFKAFLENKNLSNLTIMLMMEFLRLKDRTALYEKIGEDRFNSLCIKLLSD